MYHTCFISLISIISIFSILLKKNASWVAFKFTCLTKVFYYLIASNLTSI